MQDANANKLVPTINCHHPQLYGTIHHKTSVSLYLYLPSTFSIEEAVPTVFQQIVIRNEPA